jgi:hypothetical protein
MIFIRRYSSHVEYRKLLRDRLEAFIALPSLRLDESSSISVHVNDKVFEVPRFTPVSTVASRESHFFALALKSLDL